MKIHEYQAKQLFKAQGIAVCPGELAVTADQAQSIAETLGGRCAVKAQVHTGGRGKAGGIKLAQNPEEAADLAGQILGMSIRGHVVKKLWIEQAAHIDQEAYLSVTLDRSARKMVFISSSEGGVDIEEVADKTPEKIAKFYTADKTFPAAEARAAAEALFEGVGHADDVLEVMRRIFSLSLDTDASLVEINPLVLTKEGRVLALDGKMTFDDNALFRHPEIAALRDMDEENANEVAAKEEGLSFVQLDGNIGCMVNGAGLAMGTMDQIQLAGGAPANFLDVGGSSSPEKVISAFKLILSNKKVKAILINIFGGITRCDDIARGILESYRCMDIPVPVVVRLCGTNAKEGLELLRDSSLIPAESLTNGVQKSVKLAAN